MMECPKCSEGTKVINSRKYAGTVFRQRECKVCRFRFWTEEIEIDSNSKIIRDVYSSVKMAYRDRKRDKKHNE